MIGLGLGLARYRSGSSAPQFDPASLFASGEVGVWYDPSDLTTMFTDTAGTTQAVVGDSIARINDKSGNGLHATQATASAQPILRQTGGLYYLEFDGVDDSIVSSSIDFTASDEMSLFCGVLTIDAGSYGTVAELSVASSGNPGVFALWDRGTTGVTTTSLRFKGSIDSLSSPVTRASLPSSHVYTGQGKISTDTLVLRNNGAVAVSSTTDQGTGNFSNNPIYIGRRGLGTLPFEGRIYGFMARGSLSTADEIAAMEAHLAQKSGVTL